jgi:hypothetical protein
MKKNLYLVQKPVSLTCRWLPTGDPTTPLACVWTKSNTAQPASIASSPDESGRMHLCA